MRKLWRMTIPLRRGDRAHDPHPPDLPDSPTKPPVTVSTPNSLKHPSSRWRCRRLKIVVERECEDARMDGCLHIRVQPSEFPQRSLHLLCDSHPCRLKLRRHQHLRTDYSIHALLQYVLSYALSPTTPTRMTTNTTDARMTRSQ